MNKAAEILIIAGLSAIAATGIKLYFNKDKKEAKELYELQKSINNTMRNNIGASNKKGIYDEGIALSKDVWIEYVKGNIKYKETEQWRNDVKEFTEKYQTN